ncbi:MAG: Lipid A biosynthesis lauroyl acyltransferase, partial [uncultured Microvirga sp.]
EQPAFSDRPNPVAGGRARDGRSRALDLRSGARARARAVERLRGLARAQLRPAPAGPPHRHGERPRKLSGQAGGRDQRDRQKRLGQSRAGRGGIRPSREPGRLRPREPKPGGPDRGRRPGAILGPARRWPPRHHLLGASRQLGIAGDLRRALRARRHGRVPGPERSRDRARRARGAPRDHGRARGRRPGRGLRDAGRAGARRPSRHDGRPAFYARRAGAVPRAAGPGQSDPRQVRPPFRVPGPRRAGNPPARAPLQDSTDAPARSPPRPGGPHRGRGRDAGDDRRGRGLGARAPRAMALDAPALAGAAQNGAHQGNV